jgi:hypothetical protein
MPDSIDVIRAAGFTAAVHHLAQEGQDRSILSRVRVEPNPVGKVHYFDRLGSSDMQLKSTRHQDTQYVDIQWSRRGAFATDYDWNILSDSEDKLKTIASIDNEYVIAANKARNRRLWQYVIDSLDASAATGEAGAGTAATLPAGQLDDAGGAGTLARVTAGLMTLREKSFDLSPEEVTILCTPALLDDLLQLAQFTSEDYVMAKTLMSAGWMQWGGALWVVSNLLSLDGSSDWKNFIFHKSSVGIALWNEGTGEILKNPAKSNAMQITMKVTAGAVRIEEEGVYRFTVDQ